MKSHAKLNHGSVNSNLIKMKKSSKIVLKKVHACSIMKLFTKDNGVLMDIEKEEEFKFG